LSTVAPAGFAPFRSSVFVLCCAKGLLTLQHNTQHHSSGAWTEGSLVTVNVLKNKSCHSCVHKQAGTQVYYVKR